MLALIYLNHHPLSSNSKPIFKSKDKSHLHVQHLALLQRQILYLKNEALSHSSQGKFFLLIYICLCLHKCFLSLQSPLRITQPKLWANFYPLGLYEIINYNTTRYIQQRQLLCLCIFPWTIFFSLWNISKCEFSVIMLGMITALISNSRSSKYWKLV